MSAKFAKNCLLVAGLAAGTIYLSSCSKKGDSSDDGDDHLSISQSLTNPGPDKPTTLGQPTNLRYDAERSVLTWDNVTGASGYVVTIKVDGVVKVEAAEVNGNSYPYVANRISFRAEICSADYSGNTSAATYTDFEYVETVSLDQFDYEYGTVSWESVEGADSYVVYVNGREGVEVDSNRYTIPYDYDVTNYEVSVLPEFENASLFSSESAVFPIHTVAMTGVVFNKLDGNVNPSFTWDPAQDASGYLVKIAKVDEQGNEYFLREDNLSGLATEYSQFAFGDVGKYNVYLAAKGDESLNLYSSPFYSLQITRLAAPTIDVNAMTSDDKTHTFHWNPVEGATGYTVYRDGVNQGNLGQVTSCMENNENPDSTIQGNSFKYEVQATSSDPYVLNSALSNSVSFSVLPRVTGLRVQNGVATWDSNLESSGYQVVVDGNATNVTTNEFRLPALGEGQHTISISALGNGKDVLSSMDTASITIRKLPAPSDIRISDGHLLSWAQVDGATGYDIYVNAGSNPISTTNTSVEIPTVDASTSVTVVARGNGGDVMDSDLSSPFQIYKLSTPANLRVQDGMIAWNAVSNADHYLLQIGQSAEREVTSNNYSLDDFPAGVYTVSVKSVGKGQYFDSEMSQKVSITKLETPVGLSVTDTGIKWNSVVGAYEYEILVDDVIIDRVQSTIHSYDLTLTSAGAHTVSVRAIGSDAANICNSSYAKLQLNVTMLSPVDTVSATGLDVNGLHVAITGLDPHALGYAIVLDGVLQKTVKKASDGSIELQTVIPNPGVGEHNLNAYAIGNGVSYLNSEVIDNVKVHILSAPQNVRFVANPGDEIARLTWDGVTGATYYTVELTKTLANGQVETSVMNPANPYLDVLVDGYTSVKATVTANSDSVNSFGSASVSVTYRP